jgi:hypothetical protein
VLLDSGSADHERINETSIMDQDWKKAWPASRREHSAGIFFGDVRRLDAIDPSDFPEFFASDHLEKTTLLPNRSAMIAYRYMADRDPTDSTAV